MSKPVFYIHIRARGVDAELRLNDAPILALSRAYPQHAFPTVSEWTIDGDNELSVHIERSDAEAALDISLCEAALGDMPNPDTEVPLARLIWPPPLVADADVPSSPPPPVLRADGRVQHPWGRWSWQTAPPFDAAGQGDGDPRAAVIAWVRDLHAYLASGRVDVLADHSQLHFSEVAPVYDMDVSEAEQRLTQTWAYLQAKSGFALAPFDADDIDVRLRCNGQLAEPRTLDGQPVIRQLRAIDGESWSYPIFLARTNWEYTAGRLTILR